LNARARATTDEDVVHLDIGSFDGGGLAVFDGLGGNVVAVVVIEDEQIVVALAGREGQFAGEITVAFAGWGSINDCSEETVGALGLLEGRGKEIRIREQRKSRSLRFGGALVLPGLLEVGLGSGHSIGSVLAERVQGQARENLEFIGGNKGGLQGGGNWEAHGGMGESNKLFDLCWMKSCMGPVGDRSNSGGQVNLPKAIGGGVAAACEDSSVRVGHIHVMFAESGNTVSITELANGKKRVVNVVEDESVGGCSRKARKRKGAS